MTNRNRSSVKVYSSYLIEQLGSNIGSVFTVDTEVMINEVTVGMPKRVLARSDRPLALLHSRLLTSRDHDRLYLILYLLARLYGVKSDMDEFVEMVGELVNGYLLYTIRDKVIDGELGVDEIADLDVVKTMENLFGRGWVQGAQDEYGEHDEQVSPGSNRGTYLNTLYRRYHLYGEVVSQTIGRCYILSRGYPADINLVTEQQKDRRLRDLSTISTYSIIWLIVQQLSDDLIDWEEDLQLKNGVWEGETEIEQNVRGFLKILPMRLEEIDTISRMIQSVGTNELGLQALYYWLLERESSWVSSKLQKLRSFIEGGV